MEAADDAVPIRKGMVLVYPLELLDCGGCPLAAVWNSRVQFLLGHCVFFENRLDLDGPRPVTGILSDSPIIHRNRTVSIARLPQQPAGPAAEH